MYKRYWTEDAKNCYMRGCRCSGCYMRDLLESRPCDLKFTVWELVRKFGAPEINDEGFTKRQQTVINAILGGANDYKDLERITGTTHSNVQSVLCELYIIAENVGVRYKNRRYKLPELIRWLRGEENNDNV